MTSEERDERVLNVLRAGFASWLTPDAEPDAQELAAISIHYAELNSAQGTLPEFIHGMCERLAS